MINYPSNKITYITSYVYPDKRFYLLREANLVIAIDMVKLEMHLFALDSLFNVLNRRGIMDTFTEESITYNHVDLIRTSMLYSLSSLTADYQDSLVHKRLCLAINAIS